MKLSENDFLELDRDDLNSEFKDYSFVERKALWSFVEEQKVHLSGQFSKVRSHAIENADISNAGSVLMAKPKRT